MNFCWGAKIGPTQERLEYPPKRTPEEVALILKQWDHIFKKLGIKV